MKEDGWIEKADRDGKDKEGNTESWEEEEKGRRRGKEEKMSGNERVRLRDPGNNGEQFCYYWILCSCCFMFDVCLCSMKGLSGRLEC